MRASIGVAISAVLVITVIAHTLGIVLLVFVGALYDFHGLALEASLGALCFGIFPLLAESFRITNWFWVMLLRIVGTRRVVGMGGIIISALIFIGRIPTSLSQQGGLHFLIWRSHVLWSFMTRFMSLWEASRGTEANHGLLGTGGFRGCILNQDLWSPY